MTIPDWFTFVILVLASYEVFYLLSEATILDGPRSWILAYRGWKEGEKLPDGYRTKAAEFVSCPWCLGGWCSIAVFLIWEAWPEESLWAIVPLAVMASVGLVAHAREATN